jgi:hypothetical protein
MFTCPLCCNQYVLLNSLCDDCRLIKHTISLYGVDKVNQVLNATLIRSDKQIKNKCAIYDKNEKEFVKKNGKWVHKDLPEATS